MVENIFLKMDRKVIYYFNHFLVTLQRLLELTEFFYSNLKEYQKKVLKLYLHQTKVNYFWAKNDF